MTNGMHPHEKAKEHRPEPIAEQRVVQPEVKENQVQRKQAGDGNKDDANR